MRLRKEMKLKKVLKKYENESVKEKTTTIFVI